MPRRKPRATIYTVADIACVAISTVSRVLKDSQDVADATPRAILEAIDMLRFRLHRGAKGLAQRRLTSVALAIPTFTTRFHNERLFQSRDVQAIGTWLAIVRAGLSAPEDSSRIGYDDIKTSADVGHSSVDQHIETVDQIAAERLLCCLESRRTAERINHPVGPEPRACESSALECTT